MTGVRSLLLQVGMGNLTMREALACYHALPKGCRTRAALGRLILSSLARMSLADVTSAPLDRPTPPRRN